MKIERLTRRKGITLALLGAISGMSVPDAAWAKKPAVPSSRETELRAQVVHLEALVGDGVARETPGSLRILYRSPGSKTSDDAAALFTMESYGGGNRYEQYLAIFSQTDYTPGVRKRRTFGLAALAQVGGHGWRDFDAASARLDSDAITLSGKAYGPNDPYCCPTLPITMSFLLREGSLMQVPTVGAVLKP